jgi:hypothetical protein
MKTLTNPLVSGPTFFEFFNESSRKDSSRGEENTAKISLQYLNLLPRYLNSIIFGFSKRARLFCIMGQPFFTVHRLILKDRSVGIL